MVDMNDPEVLDDLLHGFRALMVRRGDLESACAELVARSPRVAAAMAEFMAGLLDGSVKAFVTAQFVEVMDGPAAPLVRRMLAVLRGPAPAGPVN